MVRRLIRRAIIALLGAVSLVITIASPGLAPPGDLDLTFDGDGKVTTDFNGTANQAMGVAIQADGKIIAVGFTHGDLARQADFALARYNSDGSLDSTFEGDGKVTTDFGGSTEGASAVAIQSDGKIIAIGTTLSSSGSDFALARYHLDGSLDATFDGDGRVTTDFASDGEDALAVATQPDGKILVAGTAALSHVEDFALVRYNPDGSLDTTFHGDGMVTTDFVGTDQAHALAVQGDGKILAAGCAFCSPARTSDFALARYNVDGSLDTTFGSDGKETTDFTSGYDLIYGMILQPNGKIVTAGVASLSGSNSLRPDFALARYMGDGSLDASFDADGKVTTPFGDSAYARSVSIQGDGTIIAGGLATFGNIREFALARYKSDGSLDGVFGAGDGKVTTDFGDSWDEAHAVAIDVNGRIVATGCANCFSDFYDDFALARYTTCRVTSRRSSIPCR